MRYALSLLFGVFAAALATTALDALIPLLWIHKALVATGVTLIASVHGFDHPRLRRLAGRWSRACRRLASRGRKSPVQPGMAGDPELVSHASWVWLSYAALVLWAGIETVGSDLGASGAYALRAIASQGPGEPPSATLAAAVAKARDAGEAIVLGPVGVDSAPVLGTRPLHVSSTDSSATATYDVLRDVLVDRLSDAEGTHF